MGQVVKIIKSARGVGPLWWIITATAVVLGTTSGVAIATVVASSNTIKATSSRIITSTGGVFSALNRQSAPLWSLPGLRDSTSTISIAQFQGKPLILNFWASWCAPCRKEMPALQEVAHRFQGKVTFVGVDTIDKRGTALAFLAKTGVTYASGYDPKGLVASSYGVYGLPNTFFVSPSGELLGRQVGALTTARLEELVQKVFGVSANRP